MLLQAVMPVTIFTAGLMFGTEKYSHMYFINIAVVAAGVLIATFGKAPADTNSAAAYVCIYVSYWVPSTSMHFVYARACRFAPG